MPHLHDRVAADQLRGVEVLRQDREFERPEESGLHAEQEQHREERYHVLEVEREAGQRGDPDFADLHQANEPRLLELVGEGAGGGREQEERQDEQSGGEVDVDAARILGGQEAEGQDDDERLLEQVVVERAEELRDEERRQAPGAEQSELGSGCRCGRRALALNACRFCHSPSAPPPPGMRCRRHAVTGARTYPAAR